MGRPSRQTRVTSGYGPRTTAAPAAKAYPNCSKLNQDYPHGVGKPGAKDKTSTKPVTNFYRSAKVYKMNDGRVKSKKQYDLDRDNDGIACERH